MFEIGDIVVCYKKPATLMNVVGEKYVILNTDFTHDMIQVMNLETGAPFWTYEGYFLKIREYEKYIRSSKVKKILK